MPVIEGGQVLRGGQDFGGVLGGQVLYGGQEIEPEQGGRTQPDSEAVEMSVGPFRRSGAPPNGWYNGVADKGAIAVDIATGTHYVNTGTKTATVWTADAPSGGGSGVQVITVPISSADLLAISSAPILLVASPGPGRWIVPMSIASTGHAGDTPYDSNQPVSVTSGPVAEPVNEGNVWWTRGVISACGDTGAGALFGIGQPPGDYGLLDKGLYLSAPTDPVGGNGSFDLTITYYIAGVAS